MIRKRQEGKMTQASGNVNWLAVFLGFVLLIGGIVNLVTGDRLFRGYIVNGAIGWIFIAGGVPMLGEQVYRLVKRKKPPEEPPS